MIKTSTLLVLLTLTIGLNAQHKAAYQIFNQDGKKVNYNKMLKNLNSAQVILFGELHNNPIAHWLQYEVSNELIQKNEVVLGAEMFEADNQKALTQYTNGEINYAKLDSTVRLWKNYKTDYAPLVELSKDNKLAFIATNIPRRYANLVYKHGFESLDTLVNNEKQWIAPLPIDYDAELECYKNILKMAHGHGGPNLPKAQAIKDATMAYFILENYKENQQFIHFNGAYHSDNYQGILWYLKKEKPQLSYKTITTIKQSDVSKLNSESLNKADFIIVVDENMTNTY